MNDKRKPLDGKGIISFSRVSGNQDLYNVINNVGSFIELTISTARESEFFGDTKSRPHEQLIKVAMSPVQFAAVITQMNMGSGHPCTIEYFNRERVEYIKDGVSEFEDYVEKAMDGIKETLDPSVEEERLCEIISGLRINKDTKKELMDLISPFKMHRESNRRFAIKRAGELLNKRVVEAKTDIQAHAEMMLMSTGIMATNKLMGEEKLKLGDGNNG